MGPGAAAGNGTDTSFMGKTHRARMSRSRPGLRLSGFRATRWEVRSRIRERDMTGRAQPESRLDRGGLSGPARRAFFRIAGLWGLAVEEQMVLLGLTARSTFWRWKEEDRTTVLPEEALKRISCLLGVWRALQILFPDAKAADEWVRRPNAAGPSAGRPPLDRMLSGRVADLQAVRRYLDAQGAGA